MFLESIVGKNGRDTVRHRCFSISHGSLSTLLQHTTYFTVLNFVYNKVSHSNFLPTSHVSRPVISTFKDLPVLPRKKKFQMPPKMTCSLQQEMTFYWITTVLTIISLQSSTCLWSGDAMVAHHIKFLLITSSSGRTPLIQKSRKSRKKMYAKILQENESHMTLKLISKQTQKKSWSDKRKR